MQGVFDAGLLLLHFALGRGADVDLGHAAGELGQPLFELLAVVVAGGVLDLAADLVDAALDVVALAGAFDDRRVVLVDDHLLGAAELGRASMLSSLMPRSSKIAWPPVRMAMSSSMALRRSPKPGAFTAQHVERAAELVDDQRGEGFAFDVFGDDQQRLAGVDDGFEHGHEVLDARDLLLVDEDVGVFEHALSSSCGSVTKYGER